jgi:hypothetical protein
LFIEIFVQHKQKGNKMGDGEISTSELMEQSAVATALATIYVGCALTSAPKRFRDEVESFKENLRHSGFNVLDFAWENDGPKPGVNVHEFDMECVSNCTIFVAICDLPSIGLGMELQHAINYSVPTLACIKESRRMPTIVEHANRRFSNIDIFRYESLYHIRAKLISMFDNDLFE